MTIRQSAAPPVSGDKSYDPEIEDMASYIHDYNVDSDLAFDTARLVFLDTLGCGLEALKFKECAKLLGPVVDGTVVPNGTRVPGTPYQLDPVNGAFNIGCMIRWLDYNDSGSLLSGVTPPTTSVVSWLSPIGSPVPTVLVEALATARS